ncbi:hypothetical protein [Ruegeria marina]|uniref:Uncharacterized protein n=1 Tax=Ruegeria marina TaxID=639004 RepID=A0A1G6X9M1_9RHOB|nr:hypothetical protein [Ruegeria marina]SDD74781.1 hypothetical protein SAMN04488239_11015 [Ruegeria marina]
MQLVMAEPHSNGYGPSGMKRKTKFETADICDDPHSKLIMPVIRPGQRLGSLELQGSHGASANTVWDVQMRLLRTAPVEFEKTRGFRASPIPMETFGRIYKLFRQQVVGAVWNFGSNYVGVIIRDHQPRSL